MLAWCIWLIIITRSNRNVNFRSHRKTADAMWLPCKFYYVYHFNDFYLIFFCKNLYLSITLKSGLGPWLRSWSNAPMVIKPTNLSCGQSSRICLTTCEVSAGRQPCLSAESTMNQPSLICFVYPQKVQWINLRLSAESTMNQPSFICRKYNESTFAYLQPQVQWINWPSL